MAEYLPGNSYLHRMDPRTKILWIFVLILPVMNWFDPLLCSIPLVGFLIASYLAIPMEPIWSFLKRLLPFFTILGLITSFICTPHFQALQEPRKILLYIPYKGGLPVTLEGVLFGIGTFIKTFMMATLIRTMFLVTTIKEITTSIVKWKVPPSISIAVGTAFGFLPIFLRSIQTIIDAQRSRGWKTKGGFVQKLKGWFHLTIPLVIQTLHYAQEIAVAIQARGFGYKVKQRTYMTEMKFKKVDYISFLSMTIIVAAIAILWYLGIGYGYMDLSLSLARRALGIA